ACALSGSNQQSEMLRSASGPMSPRSSVYRKKPVIHADLNILSPKQNTDLIAASKSVFEFPSSKTFSDSGVRLFFYSLINVI
ncbi:hypothetical protein AB6A40_011188, partial [Gnathostoma spinigerum]